KAVEETLSHDHTNTNRCTTAHRSAVDRRDPVSLPGLWMPCAGPFEGLGISFRDPRTHCLLRNLSRLYSHYPRKRARRACRKTSCRPSWIPESVHSTG